jgi:hypothetical protein
MKKADLAIKRKSTLVKGFPSDTEKFRKSTTPYVLEKTTLSFQNVLYDLQRHFVLLQIERAKILIRFVCRN